MPDNGPYEPPPILRKGDPEQQADDPVFLARGGLCNTPTPRAPYGVPRRATLTFDGGSRGNPGPSGYGFVLSIDGEEEIRVGSAIPDTTNNVAEYSGVIAGIERALAEGVTHLDILGDSKLIICQLNGDWQCRKEHLKPLLAHAWKLLSPLVWTATHMRRKHNSAADLLANQAMDRAAPFTIRSPIRAR